MTSELLNMQAPQGVPRSTFFETVTDPLLPPQHITEMLAHFPEQVYDKRSQSHLSRLLKVLLGDTGTGQLRKRYTYAHLSTFLLTTHYNDLDQMFSEVFGLKRFLRERLNIDVYLDAATDEEWEAINAADASYRARVEAFSRSLALAGTPSGMVQAASAVLGSECRVYESYEFLDNESVYADPGVVEEFTYGDLEEFTYGQLNGRSYAEMEGGTVFTGRLPESRGEFIVRPLRGISAEEHYHLVRVLERLKPAEALLTVDARPASMHRSVPVFRAVASSTYWHVQPKVQPDPANVSYYAAVDDTQPVQQPRGVFTEYQGEAWNYNTDVVTASSYVEDSEGNVVQQANYERVVNGTDFIDYLPELALADPAEVLLGRYVSDGVLAVSPAVRESR
jgi:hypothetical protein